MKSTTVTMVQSASPQTTVKSSQSHCHDGKPQAKLRDQTAWSIISRRIYQMIHRTFKKEPKMDEFEAMINDICTMRLAQKYNTNFNPMRGKRELELLSKKTNFNNEELKILYWGWKCACPNGVLDERTFKEIYSQFFPQAGDASLYAHYVFNAMFGQKGKNSSEQITFADYACALSLLCRGSVLQKLQWIFNLYDINGDGRVTLDEVIQISIAVYALLGCQVLPAHDNKTCEEHASRVFAKLDTNHNGFVTFEQFTEKCLKDENIIKSMQLLEAAEILEI